MKIMRKHFAVVTWIEGTPSKNFGKYKFYIFPTILFDIDYGLYSLKFLWTVFALQLTYSPFPFPKNMWETSLF